MFRTLLATSIITTALAVGVPIGAHALNGDGQNPVTKVGRATEDAAKRAVKETADAAKKAGDVTEDGARKAATETKNAGKRTEGAVRPDLTSAKCQDGSVQTGKTRADACANHGGTRK